MALARITRYPVKSLQGEVLQTASVEADGLQGDRQFGIRDETTGRVLTARRAPELLFASASLSADGEPVITLPDGAVLHGVGETTDAALSAWLGKPVRLVRAAEIPPARAEFFEDPTDDSSTAIEWTMPQGRFVDAAPLLVLTSASLRRGAELYPDGDWQVRRFRPNLFLDLDDDGWLEDGWCGTTSLRIGSAELAPQQPCIRCTMVTRPQPEIGEDRDIFRTLARHHNGHFGAWTAVTTGGTITTGDDVQLASRPS